MEDAPNSDHKEANQNQNELQTTSLNNSALTDEQLSPQKSMSAEEVEIKDQNPFTTNFQSSLGPKAGTAQQDTVIEDYPFTTFQDKLLIPYIERFNGNLCVKTGDFERALKHYSKALMGLKMIFDGDKAAFINSR
jgi:hypothetical protein